MHPWGQPEGKPLLYTCHVGMYVYHQQKHRYTCTPYRLLAAWVYSDSSNSVSYMFLYEAGLKPFLRCIMTRSGATSAVMDGTYWTLQWPARSLDSLMAVV